MRGRHARRRDADQLFCRVKEHEKNRRQRQDVAHGDALCVFGNPHDVVAVVGDGDEVRLRLGRFFLCRSFGPGLLGLFRGISLLLFVRALWMRPIARGLAGAQPLRISSASSRQIRDFKCFMMFIPFL